MFWLFFKVKWFLFQERKQVRRSFPSFLPFERALKRAYRFQNPFHLCRDHLKRQGEREPDAYGETPLPVLAKIAKACSIRPSDVVFEVGCGRGRGALFLGHLCHCTVIGIDWVPFFIRNAKEIAEQTDPSLQVTFRCEDMNAVDYSGATVIYLYGTCLSDEQVLSLVERFEKLPPQTKIITVSYPLTDYSPRFCLKQQLAGQFPWGSGEIFIHQLM